MGYSIVDINVFFLYFYANKNDEMMINDDVRNGEENFLMWKNKKKRLET